MLLFMKDLQFFNDQLLPLAINQFIAIITVLTNEFQFGKKMVFFSFRLFLLLLSSGKKK